MPEPEHLPLQSLVVYTPDPSRCCADHQPGASQAPAASLEEPKLARSPPTADGKDSKPGATRDAKAASVRARAKAWEQQQQQQQQQPLIRLPTWAPPQRAFSTTDAVLQWLNEDRRSRPSQLSSSSLAGSLACSCLRVAGGGAESSPADATKTMPPCLSARAQSATSAQCLLWHSGLMSPSPSYDWQSCCVCMSADAVTTSHVRCSVHMAVRTAQS